MIVFSRRRIAVVVILALLTAWYLGVMSRNAVPHGADRTRQEQPIGGVGGRLPAVP